MTNNEITDYILRALYLQTKDGGMLSIKAALRENNITISDHSFGYAVLRINLDGLAVFQTEKDDKRGQILPKGIEFVESSSFSNPGTSILKL